MIPNKSAWNIKNKLTGAHLSFSFFLTKSIGCFLFHREVKRKEERENGPMGDVEERRKLEGWEVSSIWVRESCSDMPQSIYEMLRKTHTLEYTQNSIYSTSEIQTPDEERSHSILSFLLIDYSTFISYCEEVDIGSVRVYLVQTTFIFTAWISGTIALSFLCQDERMYGCSVLKRNT